MTTSGTTNFTLTVEEIVEKAYNMVGGELISGEDLRQARRSLDLLFIDLQNRGYPLAKLTQITIPMVEGQAAYTLAANVVDVLDVVLTRDDLDTPLERLSLFEYHRLPKKDETGRPSQFTIDRTETAPIMYFYLSPENNTDVIDLWAVTRIQDTGNASNTVDFSYRYLPAIVLGLAYFLSLEQANFPMDKRAELRQNYQDLLEAAFSEDRERASAHIRPPSYFKRGR